MRRRCLLCGRRSIGVRVYAPQTMAMQEIVAPLRHGAGHYAYDVCRAHATGAPAAKIEAALRKLAASARRSAA